METRAHAMVVGRCPAIAHERTRGSRGSAFASLFLLTACAAAAPDESTGEGDARRASAIGDGATHRSLYVHGRTTDGRPEGWSYWGGAQPGVNAEPVNYDGGACIGDANPEIVAAFDARCRGEQWCYVVCHSLGCAHVGYALAMVGTTGEGGSRWNIAWIDAAGSAAGGSELANLGSWTQGDCAASDLHTSVVRALYDHSATGGVRTYLFAGAAGGAASAFLPGQDDGVVAYHSAGGVRTTGRYCNPGDLGCSATLPIGAASVLFAYHEVYYRDDAEAYGHGAIPLVAASDMAGYAR